MRIPTGISKLDEMMGGGLPEDSTILLIGPPGTGKSTFCQQFIYNGLRMGEYGVYVALDAGVEDIIRTMKSFGLAVDEYEKNEKLVFIDAYSWRLGEEPKRKWSLPHGIDLNGLNLTFTDVLGSLDKSRKRVVVDSVSTLLLYSSADMVMKFIPVLIAKCKTHAITQLLVLEEGVHDQRTESTLNYIADGLIEFKMEGGKNFMRIVRMKSTSHTRDWMEYKITDSGIVLV